MKSMPNSGDSIPLNPSHPNLIRPADKAAVLEAGVLVREGGLVAFPTETVYGLGADATSGEAVARIFAAKGRPTFNPLIVHVPDLTAAEKLGEFSETARTLAEKFWPGPLTLVVLRRANCGISELASAGLSTLAIRVPAHPIAQALLKAADRPLAAPSANRSGHVSATRAEHVASDLGSMVAMILDGGASRHGLESTVIDATSAEVVLLRPGAISIETLEAALGRPVMRKQEKSEAAPASPGRLESHYAPRAALRLNAQYVNAGEALLAFGPNVPETKGTVLNLSRTGDLIEAAAHLFAALRALDASGAGTIAVMPIPNHGLGEAINDRLQRAAAPRF
jgi:L-threonylcarbamoyladenylate synthase